MAAGLVLNVIQSGSAGLWIGLAGTGIGIAVFIIPYILGGMGAGDAKLMGAIGAILGPAGVFSAFLFTALAGGIYALIMIIAGRNSEGRMPRLRYAIAIAAGTLCSVLWGEEILFAGINGSFL